MSETAASTLPRVLIVDDSRMVRATIIKHIKGRFDVREEGDGEAGWQTLMLDPSIQVLISDLSMPKLDGYGLLLRVRESKLGRLREMPVIMISGDEDESARHRAKELGAKIVVSTDPIIAGVHFFATDAAADIAWKALAVNVSDLAAKGADPVAYTMALAFPEPPERGVDTLRVLSDFDPATGRSKAYGDLSSTQRWGGHTPVFDSKGDLWYTLIFDNQLGHWDRKTDRVTHWDIPNKGGLTTMLKTAPACAARATPLSSVRAGIVIASGCISARTRSGERSRSAMYASAWSTSVVSPPARAGRTQCRIMSRMRRASGW